MAVKKAARKGVGVAKGTPKITWSIAQFEGFLGSHLITPGIKATRTGRVRNVLSGMTRAYDCLGDLPGCCAYSVVYDLRIPQTYTPAFRDSPAVQAALVGYSLKQNLEGWAILSTVPGRVQDAFQMLGIPKLGTTIVNPNTDNRVQLWRVRF